MKKIHAGALIIPAICIFAACGSKQVTEVSRKSEVAKQITMPKAEEEVKEKYRYRGSNYRDPFLSLAEKRIISPVLASGGEGKMPNFGSLSLKGIIQDKNSKIALLGSPTGRYVLKNEKLYDSLNRIVTGVKGTINGQKVKLITNENFACELEFSKKR